MNLICCHLNFHLYLFKGEKETVTRLTLQSHMLFQEARISRRQGRHIHSDTGNWDDISPHTRSHREGDISWTDWQNHRAWHKTGMIPRKAQTLNCICGVKLTGTETGGAIINRDRRKWEGSLTGVHVTTHTAWHAWAVTLRTSAIKTTCPSHSLVDGHLGYNRMVDERRGRVVVNGKVTQQGGWKGAEGIEHRS